MGYVVVSKFADLQDGKHLYNVGDKFPYKRRSVSKERIAELSSSKNKVGKPLIKKVEDKDDDANRTVSESPKLVRQRSKKVARKDNNQ